MSSDDNSVRVHDYSLASSHTTQAIKNVAGDIRKSSFAASGAFEEIIQALFETTIAIRDTVNEINYSIHDLKQRGVIKDTAAAILETTNAALDTVDIAKAEIDMKKSNKTIKRNSVKS